MKQGVSKREGEACKVVEGVAGGGGKRGGRVREGRSEGIREEREREGMDGEDRRREERAGGSSRSNYT